MISELIKANGQRWDRMQIRPATALSAKSVARALVAAKPAYQQVQAKTKVPWWVVGVIHEREASQSWRASLAQGDPWDRVSVHVPRGIGPFHGWVDAAIYAMIHCGPRPAIWGDWTVGGTLTLLEEYNGLGYYHRGLPSPYIWAGTDQYRAGKFIADGHFDPHAVDKQIGCAVLLRLMAAIDGFKVGVK